MQCPLCLDDHPVYRGFFHGRRFFICNECQLLFVDPFFHLSHREEKLRYLQHRNDLSEQGYRLFLTELVDAVDLRIPREAIGLDFGSGPEPALATLLRDRGHHVNCYDPFFASNQSVLKQTYDFITCCEVAEHFNSPRDEFSTFARMLAPGGVLAMKTSLVPNDTGLECWHYLRDPTHVVFYDEKTLSKIAENFGFSVAQAKDNVIIMIRT